MTSKWLLILTLLGANLLGGPQVTKDQKASPRTANNQSSKSNRVVPPTHVIIDPPLPSPNRTQPESPNGKSESPEKPLPRFERPEWVIVYITAFYVLIAWWTLNAIKRQADMARQQVDDARASNIQTTAIASGTLQAIEHQNDLIAQSVDAASRSAEAAMLSAKTAADSLRLQQRPWIIVTGMYINFDYVKQGTRTNYGAIKVAIRNYGGSPAYRVKLSYCVGHAFPPEVPDCDMPTSDYSDIAPSAEREITAKVTYDFPDTPEMQDAPPLFIKGRLEYEGLFDTRGWTTFCGFHNPESRSLTLCGGYNETH